jgi:hypothetical protein
MVGAGPPRPGRVGRLSLRRGRQRVRVNPFTERSTPEPTDAFETWLLHRVAQAVEAGEVSATLLTDLQGGIAEAHEGPPEDRHALAIQELAERVHLPVDRLTELLANLEAQPRITRERLLRRFVEAWLMHQREAYEREQQGG